MTEGARDHYVEQAEALALATMRTRTVVPDNLRVLSGEWDAQCGLNGTREDFEEAAGKWVRTLLATPRPDARQDAGGWKMVPVVPTPRMVDAGHRIPGITHDQAATAYAEMLDAAPPAPETGR